MVAAMNITIAIVMATSMMSTMIIETTIMLAMTTMIAMIIEMTIKMMMMTMMVMPWAHLSLCVLLPADHSGHGRRRWVAWRDYLILSKIYF